MSNCEQAMFWIVWFRKGGRWLCEPPTRDRTEAEELTEQAKLLGYETQMRRVIAHSPRREEKE